MAGYNIQVTGIEELAAALKGVESKLARNVATAINKTKKKAVTFASRELRKEIPVPSRVLKKLLTNKSSANPNKLYARFVVWSGHPIPLRYFAAKQTKAGVTFRRTKADKGRMIARDAFIIRKGGRVYKRAGKARGPLEQVFGPSPGQFFQPTNLEAKLQPFISKQLPLEMKERVRVALLRQSGIIKQRKGV